MPKLYNLFRLRSRALATVLAVGLASCAEGAMAGPRAQGAPQESQPFFAAAVAHFARASDVPVRVDPRPLKPEAALRSVTESDLLADEATIRLRRSVLQTAGVPLADAAADWRCVSASALRGPPPGERGASDPFWEQVRAAEPDSVRTRREACRQGGSYVSLAFGPPQSGTRPEQPGWWRIRAIRMMLHGWEVVDLFLDRDARGEWTVVHEETRVGAFS